MSPIIDVLYNFFCSVSFCRATLGWGGLIPPLKYAILWTEIDAMVYSPWSLKVDGSLGIIIFIVLYITANSRIRKSVAKPMVSCSFLFNFLWILFTNLSSMSHSFCCILLYPLTWNQAPDLRTTHLGFANDTLGSHGFESHTSKNKRSRVIGLWAATSHFKHFQCQRPFQAKIEKHLYRQCLNMLETSRITRLWLSMEEWDIIKEGQKLKEMCFPTSMASPSRVCSVFAMTRSRSKAGSALLLRDFEVEIGTTCPIDIGKRWKEAKLIFLFSNGICFTLFHTNFNVTVIRGLVEITAAGDWHDRLDLREELKRCVSQNFFEKKKTVRIEIQIEQTQEISGARQWKSWVTWRRNWASFNRLLLCWALKGALFHAETPQETKANPVTS